MPEDPLTGEFMAIASTLEPTQGSNQTVLDILGARLITNKLFDNEPPATN